MQQSVIEQSRSRVGFYVRDDLKQNVPQPIEASGSIPTPHEVIELASDLLTSSRAFETSAERTRSAMMARMMKDPSGKQFTMALADQVLRIPDPKRAAARLRSLINQYGLPSYLPLLDRLAIRVGNWAALLLPKVVMPLVTDRIRKELAARDRVG